MEDYSARKSIFKPGDQVVILSGDGSKDYAGGWVWPMNDLVGKVVTLSRRTVYEYGWRTTDDDYTFDERFLELFDSSSDDEFDSSEFDMQFDMFMGF